MKRLCSILNLSDDDKLFTYILRSFRSKLTTFDYFVDWKKVFRNVNPIERELNLLNSLIGKDDLEKELKSLLRDYPNVIRAFPILIACREKSFDVLVNVKDFLSKRYNFTLTRPTDEQLHELSDFVCKSGLASILKDRKVKNLVDYTIGVEVGLDSNGRKNRGGAMMEHVVEVFIEEYCTIEGAEYICQATVSKIKEKWNISVEMDKSSRIVDFVINKNGKLYFVEVNFYSSGGSKLKSTATEYIEMYDRYRKQGLEFIWVTDGAGWHSTAHPLREYFDKSDYLVNLEMLRQGILKRIITN